MMKAASRLRSGLRHALLGTALFLCLQSCSPAATDLTLPPVDRASAAQLATPPACRCAVPFTPTGRFERVLVIVLENSDYKTAVANDYFRRLMRKGAYFTNFHGLFHPSYSNYLAMVTGREIVTRYDWQVNLQNVCSIADLLASKGLDWKNYAQGYPGPGELDAYPNRCATENRIGDYVRKHVPFMSLSSVQEDREKCGHIVSADRFDIDLERGSLPAYAFYSPDLINDGHDTDVERASKWLQGFLEPLLGDAEFMEKTLIVVTFDESEDNDDNRIYTVLLGGMVQPGKEVDRYCDHFSVLRTIEENFGLCPMGEGDGAAEPITEVWREKSDSGPIP